MTPTATDTRGRGHRALLTVALFAIVPLVAAACGSPTVASSSATNKHSTPTTTVRSNHTKVGSVLATSNGRTLYELLSVSGKPLPCTGACTSIWPPFLAVSGGGNPRAGSGVTARLAVGKSQQVTVGGIPLFLYSGDTASGQVNGQGIHTFGGTWHAVTPSGQPMKVAATGGSGSTGTTSGGGWG
ncbi:MAG: COG4315 family predicted lipoprotein [Acidimicrobiales bacterium]